MRAGPANVSGLSFVDPDEQTLHQNALSVVVTKQRRCNEETLNSIFTVKEEDSLFSILTAVSVSFNGISQPTV